MNGPETLRLDGAAAVLAELPMLRALPEDARRLVVESFEPESFDFGSSIVEEGEPGDALYVVVSGTARVLKRKGDGDEVSIEMLGPGDVFGEMALLEGIPRTATVRANSAVDALRLDGTVFRALVRLKPEIKEHFEREAERGRLRYLFRLSSDLSRIRAETLDELIDALERVTVAKGDVVIRQGERASRMYFVESGRLRVVWESEERARGDIDYKRRGDFFGEHSLLRGTATASVEAVTPATLLALGESDFRRLAELDDVFRAVFEEQIARYDFRFVARVPLDFADELLPTDWSTPEIVGLDQVDEVREAPQTDEQVGEEWAGEEIGAPRGRIRKFPHVWQIDEMDCGAACLAMVCRHFGRAVSLTHIRRVVHMGVDGTSLTGIAAGAESVGLRVRAVKASKSRLDELPLPAVCHFEGNHWVVLFDTDGRRVRLADPARGLVRMKRSEFEKKWSGYAGLLAYGPGLEEAPVGEPKVLWLWQFFRPFWRTLALAALLSLIAAVLQMSLPVFTQVIFDRLVKGTLHTSFLYLLLAGMSGVLVLMLGANLLQRYVLSRAAVTLDRRTLDFLTGRLLALPMRYFHSRRTGDIQRRLAGMREVRSTVVIQGVNGLTSLATFGVALAVMVHYDLLLTLVFLATAPAYAGLMRFSQKRLRPMFDSLEDAFGRYNSHQIDAIKGIETVKAVGAEHAFRRRMLTQFTNLAHRIFRADLTIMSYEAVVQIVTLVTIVLFLFVGSLRVIDHAMTIGELVAFNALVLMANGPLIVLLDIWDDLQYGKVLLNRLNDIVEHEPEQGANGSALAPVRTIEGRVELKNVGFRYSPVSPPVLEGITLSVEPGTMVAIVGRSGSGKTTLVRCLSGLLEPTSGVISYDRVDMRTLRYRELRRQIGYVLQDSYLFDDTIARNIAFGDEEPDMEQVEWAARVANAHEFVNRLQLGYKTKIGESGMLLSGGQRQRIAIARALYLKPPVLVFDEATSALDTESERAVQANVDQVFQGRTSFVIAHRLSTIRDADVIVVLEKGRLAEQGSHEELMKREGMYYYLVSQQLAL
ncbi:MAG TPA: peptidase domain-containing ABC transporter [Gaiellaceae bacterium]|nr:peptidase domain-containing ABC transporter [Gaiellaceae bacterium]